MIIWQRNQYLQTKGLFWGGKNLTQLYEEKTFNWDLECVKTVKYDKFEPSFLKTEKKKLKNLHKKAKKKKFPIF